MKSMIVSTVTILSLLSAGQVSASALRLGLAPILQHDFLSPLVFQSQTEDQNPSAAPDGKFEFSICEPDSNSFTLSNLELSPNPPVKGQKLSIKVSGELKREVRADTKIYVVVKYMKITLLKRTLDLCEELGKVGDAPEKCPLVVGHKEWAYNVDLPGDIPPGQYTVDAKIVDADREQVLCAKVAIGF